MKKHFLCAAALLCAVSSFGAKDSDPVLMNVAGKNVTLSEFQYLYNKNNNQQLEPLTIEQYLDMFVDYKLKVADAEAAGLDTTATFRAEYLQYRDELAKPYMREASVADSLARAAYAHYAENVRVSHIMLPPDPASRVRIDSLRAEIAAGKLTFEDAARRFSVDKPSAARGGLMGNVTPGRFPWAFEDAAYATAVGAVSAPVNSGFGWHLIRVEQRSPSEGEVNAAHILRASKFSVSGDTDRERVIIDSLYTVAKAGADFAALARKFSQDPGSARNGGDLGWFGRGVMVQPFDSISFALPDGGISEPFRTDFGYHIIYKKGSRSGRSFDELRPEIERMMERDERGTAPERAYADRAVAARHGRTCAATLEKVAAALATASGSLDSLLRTPALASLDAYELAGRRYTLASVAAGVAGVETAPEAASASLQAVSDAIASAMRETALEQAREQLMTTNADYRNLMNEYRDGILLFEIANSKVWDRAAKDTRGLEEFFEAHRDRYAWDAPRFKSYMIFAPDSTTLMQAVDYAATLDSSDPAAFTAAIGSKFGRDVKVERVIAAKGDNPVIDYIAFGGERPAPKSRQWEFYAPFAGHVVDAPETVADVRGAVVADYQAALEAEWLKQLHDRYPVKINKKQLKKLK